MDAAEKALSLIDEERWMYVKYEELCEKPEDTFRKVLAFCELDYSENFERELGKFELNSGNDKYEKDLYKKQIYQMSEILNSHLKYYGYI
jgi:hypothetical protein